MSDLALYPQGNALLRLAQVTLGVITPLLLSSLGGAGIAAAPLLLPALWLVGRASRSVTRGYFVVLAGLTAAEALWAATWRLGPLSLIVPAAALVGTALGFTLTFRRVAPGRQMVVLLLVLALIGGVGALQIADGGTTVTERSFERSRRR